MSLNAMTNQRPTVPAGDTIIYLQTPRGNGDLDVQEADSWDMAEEEARQATAAAAPVDDADVDSASTSSDSGTSSSGSTSSSSGAGSTGSATSATTSTIASAAVSAAGKMTAAVPANAPAAAAAHRRNERYCMTIFCAISSFTALTTGMFFTLLATKSLPTTRPQYPEEITANHVLSGFAYLVGLVSGGIAIGSAINAANRYA